MKNYSLKEQTKASFKRFFQYAWPAFIVFSFIAGATIIYINDVVHKPASYETLTLFLGVKKADTYGIASALKEDYQEQGLKEVVNVVSSPVDNAMYAQKLQVVGYASCDIFIVPESTLKLINKDMLLSFDETMKSTYLANTYDYYCVEDNCLGFKMNKASKETFLNLYTDPIEEDYYVLLNSTSKNIGTYGKYDNPSYDLALKSLSFILEEKLDA